MTTSVLVISCHDLVLDCDHISKLTKEEEIMKSAEEDATLNHRVEKRI